MAGITREQISTALFNLISPVAQFQTTGRRLRVWDQIVGCQKPAFFLTESEEHFIKGESAAPAVRKLMYEVHIFINSGTDPNYVPAIELNNIIEAIDPQAGGVLAPDAMTNRQMLGGPVWDCYIDGKIMKEPGDVIQVGQAFIPITVIMAS